ncbi:MAG: iron complex transport system substrate-binding protein [Candidatus Methanocomedens sp.]|nr:MAG: iron complex transport system substrate-binding protein [ANME-2 cluster archaeon]
MAGNKFLIGMVIIAILLTYMPSASAYTLGVFGNSNEDDTIDQKDVEYTASVVLGLDDQTQLADAKYDGEIDILDVTQIELIMLGQEKEITVIDVDDRIVTVPKPIERLITRAPDDARLAIALGVGDKLIASEAAVKSCLCPTNFGEYTEGCMDCYFEILDERMPDLPETSTRHTIDYELMASLNPDVIFTTEDADLFENKVGCPSVTFGYGTNEYNYDGLYGQIELMGYVLGQRDESDDLIDFIESKVDMVRSVTDAIDETDKPTVYFAPRGCSKGFYDPSEGRDFTRTVSLYEPLDIAGGINVARDEPIGNLNVGIEQIIAWDPDYILVACSIAEDKYAIEIIMDSDDLKTVRAVQNNSVYNCFYPYCRGHPPDRSLFNMIYMAKLLHPDEFEDLDLEAEGNEIFEAFLGVDGVFTQYADWLEWPREYLDTQ